MCLADQRCFVRATSCRDGPGVCVCVCVCVLPITGLCSICVVVYVTVQPAAVVVLLKQLFPTLFLSVNTGVCACHHNLYLCNRNSYLCVGTSHRQGSDGACKPSFFLLLVLLAP
jgi:hypothetical protein